MSKSNHSIKLFSGNKLTEKDVEESIDLVIKNYGWVPIEYNTPAPVCECGSAKVGSPNHSDWCPIK